MSGPRGMSASGPGGCVSQHAMGQTLTIIITIIDNNNFLSVICNPYDLQEQPRNYTPEVVETGNSFVH